MRRVLILTILALAVVAVGLLANFHARAMSNGAPALNCVQCHMGADKNPAKFVVEGLPKQYEPGKTYKITIKITQGPDCSNGVACGGFAVTVSAGQLKVVDNKHTFITKLPTGETIITHTKEGSKLRQWTFEWVAPSKPEPVKLQISVLAANGDGSFNGDAYAYEEITVQPAAATATATATAPKTTTTPTPTVTTTTITKVVTETTTVTTTSYVTETQTSRSPGLAIAVAVVIFIVVVGAYLAVARK
jgi:hypothetical protein